MSKTRNKKRSARKPTRTMRAKRLRLLGGALISFSVLGFLVAIIVLHGWKFVGMCILLFLVMIVGMTCYEIGKSLAAASAKAVMAKDRRPPVVYLRSFQDDEVTAKGPDFPGGGAIWAWVSEMATEEEQLAEAMKDIGPFVAIGKPGEELPGRGAARMYLADTEWRGKVQNLMSRAKLVILRAGNTDGVWWEVETAASIVRPEKILFLLPYDAKDYEAFRLKAEKYLPVHLPNYPRKKGKSAGSIRGILYFEPDWSPHFLEIKGIKGGVIKPWVAIFKTTLKPVFKQLHVKWRKPISDLYWVIPLTILSPIILFLIAWLIWWLYLGLKELLALAR